MFDTRKIFTFAALLAAILIIVSISLINVRDNGITGNVVAASSENTGLTIVFVLISLIASGLVFMTVMYSRNRYY